MSEKGRMEKALALYDKSGCEGRYVTHDNTAKAIVRHLRERFSDTDLAAMVENPKRVKILPCKVGDTIYFLDVAHPTATIEEIKITNSGTEYCWVQYEPDPETCELWDEGYFRDDDLGKTVFFSPDAVAAALAAQKGANNE